MKTGQQTTGDGRPACTAGHVGKVAIHGRFVRVDGQFSRPRFRCYPDDGSPWHTFSLPRRQPTAGNPHGLACEHCEHEYGPADGPRAVHRYAHTISEVAGVLAAVGAGSSLRVASRDIRQSSRRFTLGSFPVAKTTTRRRRDYSSRQNVLAARYLDAYGPQVLSRALPDRWPRLLILYSKPLKIRPYGVVDWKTWDQTLPGGALLTAAGRDDEESVARAWRISLGGDETKQSWLRFFDELPGAPEWVVMDRSLALTAAVQARWPSAIIFYCAYHLGENLAEAAKRDGVYHPDSPFPVAIRTAFHSVAQWEALADLTRSKAAQNVIEWMAREDRLIRRQIDLRAAFPERPRSNGAAEAAIKTVNDRIGARRCNFRNAGRLNTVLGLMTAHIRQVGDPLAYANLVREMIATTGSPSLAAGMDHGALVNDEATGIASMAALLLSAGSIRASDKRAYDVSAKTRSVQLIAEGLNAERAKAGLPLLQVRISNGGVAAVSVKGKLLTDFHEFAAQWDITKNGRGPDGVTAGDSLEAWWICYQGHSWQTKVVDRLTRLTRCQRCVTRRADESSSLAAIYPQLLATWDEEANRPLTPQTIRATYQTTVRWRCLAGRNHPVYAASIKKQIKEAEKPCPLCRKMETAGKPQKLPDQIRPFETLDPEDLFA